MKHFFIVLLTKKISNSFLFCFYLLVVKKNEMRRRIRLRNERRLESVFFRNIRAANIHALGGKHCTANNEYENQCLPLKQAASFVGVSGCCRVNSVGIREMQSELHWCDICHRPALLYVKCCVGGLMPRKARVSVTSHARPWKAKTRV